MLTWDTMLWVSRPSESGEMLCPARLVGPAGAWEPVFPFSSPGMVRQCSGSVFLVREGCAPGICLGHAPLIFSAIYSI